MPGWPSIALRPPMAQRLSATVRRLQGARGKGERQRARAARSPHLWAPTGGTSVVCGVKAVGGDIVEPVCYPNPCCHGPNSVACLPQEYSNPPLEGDTQRGWLGGWSPRDDQDDCGAP
jgi:hypothetical protein